MPILFRNKRHTDMTHHILLMGCGNIGSRHLQGLAKLKEPVTVNIVEPQQESQKIAKNRLIEIPFDKDTHNFFWHESLKEIKEKNDLVIVATTAHGRIDLINQLIDRGNDRFLVEKPVCQSSQDYNKLLEKISTKKIKGWVNTPRRYFSHYQKIHEQFKLSKNIFLSIITGNMGLGTNAIHFVDMFSWLCNDPQIQLDGKFLHDTLFQNKRGKDFLEFAGTIFGRTQNNSQLMITFLPSDQQSLTVDVLSENKRIMIDEMNEKVILNNGVDVVLKMHNQFQSDLTPKIVSDILFNDKCLLPTLEYSKFGHEELFRIFNWHIKKVLNEDRIVCPIT